MPFLDEAPTPLEIEQLKAAIAMHGLGEAIIPMRIFYFLGKTVAPQYCGRDATGNYIDVGGCRVRPLVMEASRTFASKEEIGQFVAESMKGVRG